MTLSISPINRNSTAGQEWEMQRAEEGMSEKSNTVKHALFCYHTAL